MSKKYILLGGQINEDSDSFEDSEDEEQLDDKPLYKIKHANTLEYSEPTKANYTIPQGTILFHGSMFKETFSPFDIRLSNESLVAFFTESKDIAESYIMKCINYPNVEGGYLHKFKVKKDIDKIKIISIYSLKKNQKDLSYINENFCKAPADPLKERYNGIGFFYSRELNEDIIINKELLRVNKDYDAEFAICDPNEFLEYVNTERCIAPTQLSQPYRFDK